MNKSHCNWEEVNVGITGPETPVFTTVTNIYCCHGGIIFIPFESAVHVSIVEEASANFSFKFALFLSSIVRSLPQLFS
jgi:hypothetical protein